VIVDERLRDVKVILVFRIGSLGDTAVALPALREIRRRHARSRIVLLTNTPVDGGTRAPSAIDVLAGTGLIDHYIEYPHGSRSPGDLFGVIRQIRAAGPGLCFFLLSSRSRVQTLRDRIFFRLCGIRKIVGIRQSEVWHRPPQKGEVLWESEAKRALRAAGVEGRGLSQEEFSLVLSADEEETAEKALLTAGVAQPFIVISVGARLPVKDWGEQRWSQCLQSLGGDVKEHALVAVGSKMDADRSRRIMAYWPWKTANFCGQLTSRQSAAVIRRARLFVGHDSGPMHLASAVGTPLVAVFSAREMPGIWFPFGQEANAIYKDVPCRGCRLEVCIHNKQRCVTEIQPGDVAKRAADLLSQSAT